MLKEMGKYEIPRQFLKCFYAKSIRYLNVENSSSCSLNRDLQIGLKLNEKKKGKKRCFCEFNLNMQMQIEKV